MASTLKKDSSVNEHDYNNYILEFKKYCCDYQKIVKNIVDCIIKTVMVQEVWTDKYAQQYALWFNDESGVTDGCDRLNSSMSKIEALFKTTCYTPVKDVVKLIGEEEIDSCAMIRKAYQAKDIYSLLEIKKYRKKDFPRIPLKRKKGWKAVARSKQINDMVKEVEAGVKKLKNLNDKIKKLVKQRVLEPSSRCIMITGFDGSQLNKTISEITNHLEKFTVMNRKKTDMILQELGHTQENISEKINTVVYDDGKGIITVTPVP